MSDPKNLLDNNLIAVAYFDIALYLSSVNLFLAYTLLPFRNCTVLSLYN